MFFYNTVCFIKSWSTFKLNVSCNKHDFSANGRIDKFYRIIEISTIKIMIFLVASSCDKCVHIRNDFHSSDEKNDSIKISLYVYWRNFVSFWQYFMIISFAKYKIKRQRNNSSLDIVVISNDRYYYLYFYKQQFSKINRFK